MIGEAGDYASAIRLANEREPDLTLLDLNLKGSGGLEILSALKEEDPSRRVVMLTVSDAPEDLMAAIRAGADGYLLKDTEPEELLERVRGALEGRTVISDSLTTALADALRDEARGVRRDNARSDRSRTRGSALRGRRTEQQGDRAQPFDHRGHRQGARQAPAEETRLPFARRGRRLGFGAGPAFGTLIRRSCDSN